MVGKNDFPNSVQRKRDRIPVFDIDVSAEEKKLLFFAPYEEFPRKKKSSTENNIKFHESSFPFHKKSSGEFLSSKN